MAETSVTLIDGYKVGDELLTDAVLRDVCSGDIINAQEESEKLVMTATGPELVPSPALVGVNILRRQIVRIGNVDGPISLKEMKKLTPTDLNLLQGKADEMDAAVAAEAARKKLGERGRGSGVGE